MTLSPTTNIAALVARRNLDENGLQATRSIAKVSQGTRIVKPMDDASSLAIANKMRSNIQAMEQGMRNTTQGSSLLQVAAGGLDRTSDILSRMKQLAVQVINDTLGAAEISYANEEFSQLVQQIDRSAEQTRFNGNSLLTGGSGNTNSFNDSKSATNLNSLGAPSAAFTTDIVASSSSGFVYHDFSSGVQNVKVTHDDEGIYLDVGGELFKGAKSVSTDEVYVLTSTSNSDNRIAIQATNDVTTADTVSELKESLQAVFQDANLRIGIGHNAPTVDAGGADVTVAAVDDYFSLDANATVANEDPLLGLINWSETTGVVQGGSTNATLTGDNGDVTISVEIGSETFRATSVTFADNGTLKLVSTRNNGNVLALNMSTNIGGGAVFNEANAQTALQAIFGGAGATNLNFAIGDSERSTQLGAPNVAAGAAVPFDTTGLCLTNTQGFIDGVVSDVTVENNGDAFDIHVRVGDQTFTAYGYKAPNAAHEMNLVSQSDPQNVISFNATADADTFLTSREAVQSNMEILLGLDPSGDSGPVKFYSASGANHLNNGIEMGTDHSIQAGVATDAGTYAFSYDSSKHEFKLTNGVDTWRETFDPENDYISDGEALVEFGNGITVRLGDGLANNFDHEQSVTQMVFDVDQEGLTRYEFQVSDVAGDDMGIAMTAATVDALGLSDVSINGKEYARKAQTAIDMAINTLNTGLANIGALQSRFEYVRVNLQIQIENTKLARATFYDVDMAAEITNFTKFQTLTQAATSMLSQANELPQNLLRLLP